MNNLRIKYFDDCFKNKTLYFQLLALSVDIVDMPVEVKHSHQ